MTISVIIPTFHRPALLEEAVASICKQSLLPLEIIIGDDSRNDETEELILRKLSPISCVPIRYVRHKPSAGQASNVDRLIHMAEGELIALLHDDDLFCLDALLTLEKCFAAADIAVAYGKQYCADATGNINEAASEEVNNYFYRSCEYAGTKLEFLEAAILQQFPNDGFLIRSDIAKAIGYIEGEALMGDACDLAFSILCAHRFPKMKAHFLNEFTAVYRASPTSIARSNPRNNAAYRAFQYVSRLPTEITSRQRIRQWLREKSPVAIAQACILGHKTEARHWYFSEWHREKILSLGGLRRGWMLI
jgi:glycosyltransferase involved in cell wall biosynthesis